MNTFYAYGITHDKKKNKELFATTTQFTDISTEFGLLATSDCSGFFCWDWKQQKILCRVFFFFKK